MPDELSEAIRHADAVRDELCIVAKLSWTSDSAAKLIQLTKDFRVLEEVAELAELVIAKPRASG